MAIIEKREHGMAGVLPYCFPIVLEEDRGIPSRPGDFNVLGLNAADRTSSSVNGREIISRWLSDRVGRWSKVRSF